MANLSRADLHWALTRCIKDAERHGATIDADTKYAAEFGEDGMWNLLEMIQFVERANGRAQAKGGP